MMKRRWVDASIVAGVCLLAYGLYAEQELIALGGTIAAVGWVEKKRQRDEADAERIARLMVLSSLLSWGVYSLVIRVPKTLGAPPSLGRNLQIGWQTMIGIASIVSGIYGFRNRSRAGGRPLR